MNQISFQYPTYYLLFCLLVAIVAVAILYYKTTLFSDRPYWYKVTLALLRGLSVFMLCFLLLNPLFRKYETEIKKPILAIAVDHSESMVFRDSTWTKTFEADRTKLISDLSDKYEVMSYQFGDQVLNKDFPVNYSGKRTNVNDVLDVIQDQTDPQYLKGIVIASDGIFNSGKNPLYHSIVKTIPFYTVLHGDTTQEKDLSIQREYHNDIIYSGDKFSMEIDLQAWQCASNSNTLTIQKLENETWRSVYESNDKIDNDQYFLTKEIILDAPTPGIFKYRINCKPISGERNLKNNSKEFYIEVLDAKKKVLIYALSPHPDISAIKDALQSNKNYEVKIAFNGETIQNIESYSFVIFHQLPGPGSNITGMISKLDALKLPRMFIIGNQTDIITFNNSQNIIKILGNNKNLNDAQALVVPNFNAFILSENLINHLSQYPPLSVPFGNYNVDPTANYLLYQKIGKIDTKYPLWIFNEASGIKTSVLCGEGIWKWRLNEYVQSNSFEPFNELISKSFQYASIKEDKRKFKVNQSKRLFDESEPILFNADLYNDNYERINTPDIAMKILSNDKKSYEFVFGKKDNYYELNAGSLPSGEYKYIASVTWNGKPLTAEGKFGIQQTNIETSNLVANHNVLRNLAEKMEGISVYKNQLQQLTDHLLNKSQNKPILFQTIETKPLIDRKWYLVILFLCLSLEWFLRRYWGSY